MARESGGSENAARADPFFRRHGLLQIVNKADGSQAGVYYCDEHVSPTTKDAAVGGAGRAWEQRYIRALNLDHIHSPEAKLRCDASGFGGSGANDVYCSALCGERGGWEYLPKSSYPLFPLPKAQMRAISQVYAERLEKWKQNNSAREKRGQNLSSCPQIYTSPAAMVLAESTCLSSAAARLLQLVSVGGG